MRQRDCTNSVPTQFATSQLANAISEFGYHQDGADPELPTYLDEIVKFDTDLIAQLFSQVRAAEVRENRSVEGEACSETRETQTSAGECD